MLDEEHRNAKQSNATQIQQLTKLQPKAMAASLPMTWHATMLRASHCVGLTLPGMMDDPGSLAGNSSSLRPQRGPEPSKRRSLATFMRAQASTLRAPEQAAMASWPANSINLLAPDTNGSPEASAISAATRSAYLRRKTHMAT